MTLCQVFISQKGILPHYHLKVTHLPRFRTLCYREIYGFVKDGGNIVLYDLKSMSFMKTVSSLGTLFYYPPSNKLFVIYQRCTVHGINQNLIVLIIFTTGTEELKSQIIPSVSHLSSNESWHYFWCIFLLVIQFVYSSWGILRPPFKKCTRGVSGKYLLDLWIKRERDTSFIIHYLPGSDKNL